MCKTRKKNQFCAEVKLSPRHDNVKHDIAQLFKITFQKEKKHCFDSYCKHSVTFVTHTTSWKLVIAVPIIATTL